MKLINVIVAGTIMIFASNVYADVAVVVNKSNAVELSKGKIKRVFLKKIKTFENGNEIRVASMAEGHPVSTEFNARVLGRTASKLKAYWAKLTFTGQVKPMEYADSSEEMIEKVKSDPNMIAYIDASKVTDDVRVIGTF